MSVSWGSREVRGNFSVKAAFDLKRSLKKKKTQKKLATDKPWRPGYVEPRFKALGLF